MKKSIKFFAIFLATLMIFSCFALAKDADNGVRVVSEFLKEDGTVNQGAVYVSGLSELFVRHMVMIPKDTTIGAGELQIKIPLYREQSWAYYVDFDLTLVSGDQTLLSCNQDNYNLTNDSWSFTQHYYGLYGTITNNEEIIAQSDITYVVYLHEIPDQEYVFTGTFDYAATATVNGDVIVSSYNCDLCLDPFEKKPVIESGAPYQGQESVEYVTAEIPVFFASHSTTEMYFKNVSLEHYFYDCADLPDGSEFTYVLQKASQTKDNPDMISVQIPKSYFDGHDEVTFNVQLVGCYETGMSKEYGEDTWIFNQPLDYYGGYYKDLVALYGSEEDYLNNPENQYKSNTISVTLSKEFFGLTSNAGVKADTNTGDTGFDMVEIVDSDSERSITVSVLLEFFRWIVSFLTKFFKIG